MIRIPIPMPIVVHGAEPLCGRVVAGLRADGRAARAIAEHDLTRLAPAAGRTLILANPPDPEDLLARLLTAWPWTRGTAPRVILMHPETRRPALGAWLSDARLRLEPFAIEQRAARALLARWPPHAGLDPPFGQVPHLLIAGLAAPAHAILRQALHVMHYGGDRPRVTILCADPAGRAAWRFRALARRAAPVAAIELAGFDAPPLDGAPPVTLAFVCPDDPRAGPDRAGALARELARRQRAAPPILLETGEDVATGDLRHWDGQIIPVSHLREACRAAVLLDRIDDDLARIIHERYLDTREIASLARDPVPETAPTPATQPWERLPEAYRQACRHQADHLEAKLAITDRVAVDEDRARSFAFTRQEIEHLSEIEHQRWAANRYLGGWTHGAVRDDRRRRHPDLVPYARLSEPVKDNDRLAVRNLTALLARSGRGIRRLLIVGIQDPPDAGRAPPGRDTWIDALLQRLAERHPEHALVLAGTLHDALSRRIVRRALDRFDAGFFWLLPGALDRLPALRLPADAPARLDVLALAARASRRIQLGDAAGLREWLARRARIAIALDDPAPPPEPARRILVRADGTLDWNFEYA